MKHLLFLLLFLYSSICFGQTNRDSLSIGFIRQIVKPSKNGEKIIYAKTLTSRFSKYYKEKLAKMAGVFFNKDQIDSDTLRLTQAEITYLFLAIDSVQNYIWNENMFPNSSTIIGDSVWNFLVKNPHTPSGKKTEIHLYSRPIFIRGNTICLFYHMHFIGVGGPDDFAFYKFENGNWKYWIIVSGGYLN